MRNHKQAIGYFRVIVYLVLLFTTNISMNTMDLKFWVSDMIHGSHTIEFRDSLSVSIVFGTILAFVGFYIIQTFVYIIIGNDLSGKNTGILRFLYYVIRDLIRVSKDPDFWSSDSKGGDLNNIERVLSYRDNKMAFMSNKEAAEYIRGTGHVDMLLNRPDLKQSRKTLSYLNNKMAFMDNETALNFLKGNK